MGNKNHKNHLIIIRQSQTIYKLRIGNQTLDVFFTWKVEREKHNKLVTKC